MKFYLESKTFLAQNASRQNYQLVRNETTRLFQRKPEGNRRRTRILFTRTFKLNFQSRKIATARPELQSIRRFAVNTSTLNSKIVIPSAKPIFAIANEVRDFFPSFFFIQRSVRLVAFLSRKKVISYFHRILFSCLHIHPYVCVLNFSSVSSDSQHFHPEQDFKRFTVPRNQFIRILEHRLTDLFTYKKLPLIDETLLA